MFSFPLRMPWTDPHEILRVLATSWVVIHIFMWFGHWWMTQCWASTESTLLLDSENQNLCSFQILISKSYRQYFKSFCSGPHPPVWNSVVQIYLFFHASNFLGTSKLQVEWKSLSMHYSIPTCYIPFPSRRGFGGLLYQHLAMEVNDSDSSASVSVHKLLYSTMCCLWPLVPEVSTLCILETRC